ncbi:MAG TPA: DUF2889 domain-containing protein [Sphingobium sp.]
MSYPAHHGGFRRRILIEPATRHVTAELEDDYHRMVVTLHHADGIVSQVDAEMKRAPWTLCPGAIAQLAATFSGEPLADFARRGEKTQNCTHLHDLALFAAAHADRQAATSYEIYVTDAVEKRRSTKLWRNGTLVFDWHLDGDLFRSPGDMAGLNMGELNPWIGTLDPAGKEAARILRWASILALGRGMSIPVGLSATAFPSGSCYNFQPGRASKSTRRPDADVDFSVPGLAPMADRGDAFCPVIFDPVSSDAH